MMKIVSALIAITLCVSCCHAESTPTKKLIEFGWDEPSTSFMRKHIEQMEKTPFDGTVYHVDYTTTAGTSERVLWEMWGRRAFDLAGFASAIADLKATSFTRMRHNFLRVNVTPGDVDWFDDFTAITNNCRVMAIIAKTNASDGVLFDTEMYQKPLFTYPAQAHAKTKMWDAYAAQSYKRGQEVMNAFQDGYPDLTVLLTFGYSLPWSEVKTGKPLAECGYGLMVPFLDGMLNAARGKARIVDGFEISYGYQGRERFAEAREGMTSGVLAIVRDADHYRQHMRPAFALWLDYDWRNKGWNPTGTNNYFTPQQFGDSLSAALEFTDEYVWIYTEKPLWWTETGGPKEVAPEYIDVIRRAKGTVRPGTSTP